ncbi:molybdopterin-guanine dinucleotide biosynthesis protein B [Acidocella sp. C78]|uniref:molybdopterin-guanine dinucleotide biosynthesis protein B n=1 Tax=Acidocella sp. C78 TaxID=1671486 RepID=UPI00191B9A5F|nr:molybdopterin-guanine dinucleotide biosynthesis protein B [Acidocella sp. C78]
MPPLPLRGPQGAPVLALVGWSGSGKTTLLTAVLPLLTDAGLRVSTLKHAHHKVDPDQEGKDSFRHRAAGAHETMLATTERFVLFHDHRSGADEPDLPALLARMAPADLFIAEGFKSASVAKIEVHRPMLGKPSLWPDFDDIVAVASDAPLAAGGLPVLPLNHPAMVADFILRWRADAIA